MTVCLSCMAVDTYTLSSVMRPVVYMEGLRASASECFARVNHVVTRVVCEMWVVIDTDINMTMAVAAVE